MENYKSKITLNEKDSLTDILMAEKELVKMYAQAMTEGAGKPFRSAVKSNMDGAIGDQFAVFTAMNKNGLYETTPADKAEIDKSKETYSQMLTQLN